LAWKQHDIYKHALSIILQECRVHFVKAYQIAGGLDSFKLWSPDQSTDHRTLQNSHDILAAVWRFQNSPPQPSLFKENFSIPSMDKWIEWLHAEVHSWLSDPDIVRLIALIIKNQNNEKGYEAEDQLDSILRRKFHEVNWN
jgi:hypothetical protein